MISHLTNTVTFMTNSIGESRHVGHSIIRFKSIYFYAVNPLIVQYMHTCIYLTDISNTNNSNKYTYTYMYFTNSIHNRSHTHLSSYHLCMTNISNNKSFKSIYICLYIYIYIYIYIYFIINIHNQSQLHFNSNITFVLSFQRYTHSCIHSRILIPILIHVYSFISPFTYAFM